MPLARASSHEMPHEHAHGAHDHGAHAHDDRAGDRARLLVVLACGLVITAAEVVGGLLANSLVLLADAAHYATDVFAVGIAYVATGIAMRPANARKTYGYQRAEVVAAFVNAAALWGLSAYFLYEAYRRVVAPPTVDGALVMLVGGVSLVVNAGLALVLTRRAEGNLNVRAAYLHVLSDVAGSAAALVSGALVAWFGWHVADPLVTLFITVLILVFTWRLTRDTLHILLQGTPRRIDMEALERTLREVAPVKEVHELHVWSLTSGSEVLSVHVVLDAPPQGDEVTHDIHALLRDRFGIDHVTVQVESPECPCDSARCAPTVA
jgi:cobalt-zinc-cadmium efflux system protein